VRKTGSSAFPAANGIERFHFPCSIRVGRFASVADKSDADVIRSQEFPPGHLSLGGMRPNGSGACQAIRNSLP
jgi:hypothetical protein